MEGEGAVKDGRTSWDCIHKLQRSHGGRRSVKTTAALKDDTNEPEEVLDRYYQDFSRVLNFQSINADN